MKMGQIANEELRWRIVGRSVRGASHVRRKESCQDAILWRVLEDAIILAVADGHGSNRSPYSADGAQIAVDVAVDALEELYRNCNNNLITAKRIAEEQLPQLMVRAWAERVQSIHIEKERPFDSNVLVQYGSTLLSVLATSEFLLLMQIGDGDMLIVNKSEEKNMVLRPISKDKRLIGNETTSLCRPEAWKDFYVKFIPIVNDPPALILVCTDGYTNSFQDEEEFQKAGPDFLELISLYGINEIDNKLEEWLLYSTNHGSGDDITVGLICRNDLLPG